MLPRVRSLRGGPCAYAWWAHRSRRAPCAAATRSPRAPKRASCTSTCPSLSAGTAGPRVMRMAHANRALNVRARTLKLITDPLFCLLELLFAGVRLESQRLDQLCETNNLPLLSINFWHLNGQWLSYVCKLFIARKSSFHLVYKTTNLHNGETRRGFLSFETEFRYYLLVDRELSAHAGDACLELLDAHVAQLDFALRALDLCSEHLRLVRHSQVVRWLLSKQSLMNVNVLMMLPQCCNLYLLSWIALNKNQAVWDLNNRIFDRILNRCFSGNKTNSLIQSHTAWFTFSANKYVSSEDPLRNSWLNACEK